MKAPSWLTGPTPVLIEDVCRILGAQEDARYEGNYRRCVWLRNRRQDPMYRKAEVNRQRERRAAQRESA